jgi:hypothetical protein
MLKILSVSLVVSIVLVTSSCAVFVNTPADTTVETKNNLNSMSVDVGGITTNVDGIDLENVTIGDVVFSSVPYGTTSAEKVTNSSGDVDVTIGTAIVYTTVLGLSVPISFSNISPMTTTITPETLNTVVFNQTTAGVIFQALGKKKKSRTL